MEPKPGDKVEVEVEDEKITGILVQSSEPEDITIKLPSGYNLSINKLKAKIKTLEKAKTETEKKKAAAKAAIEKKGLKTISILHTGGTIASKIDYATGGVTAKYDADEMLALFPKLNEIANIKSRKIMQTQSEMIRFSHYNIMAEEIKKEIENGTDGIILTHGTDTMHYTSAALAFIIENLPVPVVLVGAQRSSDRGSTDATYNLISAAYFITKTDFAGIAICMHEDISDKTCLILPATKSRKMHTSRRDAFRPINTTAIARVDYESGKIEMLTKEHAKKTDKNVSIKPINEAIKVAIIKTHTNMHAEQFEAYKGYDALVIEGTGLGHIPNQQIDEHTAENKKIHDAVKKLISQGTIVMMAPQTIYGRIQMQVYSPQRELMSIGVLGHLSDMTAETAFIKLAWLLSNYTKEETKELITKNLRGEITERTEKEAFLT